MVTNPLSLGQRKKPTLKHRPAIWECMLATVYAQSPTGEVKYFDYDWDAAVAFAGVTPEGDPRVWRAPESRGNIRRKQLVLYVLR